MAIRHKLGEMRSLQSFVRKKRWQKSHRINVDTHLRLEVVIKIDGLPIDEDQIYLRVRDTARLDHIFYRRFFRQLAFDNFRASFGSEEKRKIAVETYPNCERAHVISRF